MEMLRNFCEKNGLRFVVVQLCLYDGALRKEELERREKWIGDATAHI